MDQKEFVALTLCFIQKHGDTHEHEAASRLIGQLAAENPTLRRHGSLDPIDPLHAAEASKPIDHMHAAESLSAVGAVDHMHAAEVLSAQEARNRAAKEARDSAAQPAREASDSMHAVNA